ncbi:MAG: beta-ketoacyl-ACP synthase II [Vampirovibrionales bacterium]
MTQADQKRRVVVTGVGMVAPTALVSTSSGNPLPKVKVVLATFPCSTAPSTPAKIAGEVEILNPVITWIPEAKRMDRYCQLAMAAAKLCYEDSGLKEGDVDPERFGVFVGSAAGGITTIENQVKEVTEKGYRRTSPFLVPMMICNISAGRIAIRYNAKGPNEAVVTACSTGAQCIGDAYRTIKYGDADACFAGGSEAPLSPISVSGFAACRALSTRNDDPQHASRPFDKGRDGFVMSEGACIVMLEELETAKKRGARIYGEIIGYGSSNDAHDIVQPPEDGKGAALAIKNALKNAGLNPEDIDYINAHGTSTPLGDVAETNAIKTIFGDHAKGGKLLVSSTKSMTGHLLGAAGSAEVAISMLALRDQLIPPTTNIEELDERCDLDYVPNEARKVSGATVAMSNSFGFGGHNSSIVMRKWENN